MSKRELASWMLTSFLFGALLAVISVMHEQSAMLDHLVGSWDNMYTNTVITIKK